MNKGPMPAWEWTDKPGVIAQAGSRRVLADGTLEHNNYPATAWKPVNSLMHEERRAAALLADAARQVRKDCYESLRDFNRRLTERIEAVEKAIQDTRVDQGEMGLITAHQENNIMNQLKSLADRLVAVEAVQKGKALDFEAAARMVRSDSAAAKLANQKYQSLVDRLTAVEHDAGELLNSDFALADRLVAVESETASMRTLILSSERRKEDGGIFQASTHRALDDILDRLSALEEETEKRRGVSNKRIDWANDLHDKLSARVAEIDKRLSTSVHDLDLWCEENIGHINSRLDALEASMPVPGPCPGEDMRDQLEARRQDEATEGETPRDTPDERYAWVGPWCVPKKSIDEVRRELAREIAEGLRCGNATSGNVRAALRSQEICANWIEREFEGEQ